MWMKPHGYLINGNYYDENISTDELDLVLPLYAIETQPPQIKELSDEEIDRVVDETYGVPRNPVIYAMHRRLAKAILKKASEK